MTIYTKDSSHSEQIKIFAGKNHGYIGALFSDYLLSVDSTRILEEFQTVRTEILNKISKKCGLTERLTMNYAMIITTSHILNRLGVLTDTKIISEICIKLHNEISSVTNPGKNLAISIFNYICSNYKKLDGVKWTLDKDKKPVKVEILEATFKEILEKTGNTNEKTAVKFLLNEGFIVPPEKNRIKAKISIDGIASYGYRFDYKAETNKMEIENYYIDMAKTGRNTNRPKYQQLKTDIENGNVKAKTIIVRALDRLHRNAANQLEDLEWFEKNGIRLIAVNDGTDTASPNYNKLITTVKAAVAEEFSDTLSKNTRAALLECAKQCRHLGGIPPIGYNINNIGLYEIDELTAPIVRDIFNLYSKDMGYDYIKKHLKNKGYKTSTGKDFVDSSIHSILTNPKYKGTYIYDRTAPKDSEGHRNSHKEKQQYVKIPNGMPAIIKPELFDKVQEKMIKNAHKNTHRTGKNYYSLNGFMHCSKCGKAFSGNVNNSNGHKYLQYKKSCDCKIKSVRTDQLNKFVFYAIKNCIFNPDNKQKIINAVNKKLSIQKQINSEEINAIQNKINGFEKSNINLMKYLESNKANG